MLIYYAQNKEDLFIKAFFPDIKEGFYIDVGANDPLIDSVTKLLYDQGWHGINVDPIHKHIVALNRERPRDINLQIGVGKEKGSRLFTEYTEGDGLSTFAEHIRKHYQHNREFPTTQQKEYEVPIKTLEEIIKENKVKHIHVLKIDVEGYEHEVISGYGWESPRPELICIEVSHILKDWRLIIEAKNYKMVFFDGVNNYYLAKEALSREKYFNYPNAALAGNPIYYPVYIEVIAATKENEDKKWRQREQLLQDRLADKEQEVSLMQSQQRDVRVLVKRLNSELQVRINRRANAHKADKELSYKNDKVITAAINKNKSAKNLLEIAHSRDKLNIVMKRKLASSYIKVLFWKSANKLYVLFLKMVKRVIS